jgi:hypothetical protein
VVAESRERDLSDEAIIGALMQEAAARIERLT